MELRMKSADSQSDWLNRLPELGCRASWRPAPFGRTFWLVKKDGEAIRVLQDQSTGLTTKIDNPTAKQREIAAALVTAGIAVVASV